MYPQKRYGLVSVSSVVEGEGLWYELPSEEVSPGALVVVPLRKRLEFGYLREVRQKLPGKAKKWHIRPLHAIIAHQWLSPQAQHFLHLLSRWYWYPFSLLWVHFLPPQWRIMLHLRLERACRDVPPKIQKYLSLIPSRGISLTTYRQKVKKVSLRSPSLKTLKNWEAKGYVHLHTEYRFSYPWDFPVAQVSSHPDDFALHIKTQPDEEERREIRRMVSEGGQILLLVPEWNLLGRFSFADDSVPLYFSQRNPREIWRKILRGEPGIYAGGHSLIFAPYCRLRGIYILWPEDGRFFYPSAPHQHTSWLACQLGKIWGARLVAFSFAPPFWLVSHHPSFSFSDELPSVEILSLKGKKKASGMTFSLYERLLRHCEKGEKTAFLVKRRGFAGLMCYHCHQPVLSECCGSALFLQSRTEAMCSSCGNPQAFPGVCPACGLPRLGFSGLGIERLKESLARLFPDVPVFSYSPPFTSAGLTEFLHHPSCAFLVGTPALADEALPSEIIRVIPLADSFWLSPVSLSYPYDTVMETLSLFLRFLHNSHTAYIQSHHPEFYLLEGLAKRDLEAIYEKEKNFRERLGFPPYRSLLEIIVEGKKGVEEVSRRVCRFLQKHLSEEDLLSGPHFLDRQGKKSRYRIWVKWKALENIPYETLQKGVKEMVPEGIFARIRLIPGGSL
ncbi:MAG: hypothetical protein V2G33_08005 [bacterium JZ-2024 1]